MNKKQTIKKTAALLLGLTLAMSATGCGFITTDNQKDLDQVVAKVDITKAMEDDTALASQLSAFKLSGEVKKRELISYYLSIGYQYVNNYGYSYEDAFNLLLNALINKETLAQEAFAYFLKKNNLNAEAFESYRQKELEKLSKNEQEVLGKDGKYAEILALKYVLTNNNTEMDDYNVAEYTLKKNLNNSIDSLEKSLITVEEEKHDHGTARTLPTNVGTEVEDYYVEGYEVYTGRNGADACEGYERLEGSTVATRQKAYNAFLSNLQEYNLVNASGKEDTSKITSLEYYYVELASLLEQRLINKYYEAREEAITAELDANEGEYVKNKYAEMYDIDAKKYDGKPTTFAGAMDSVSAESFLLYAPLDQNEEKDMTFGYVYNILIPFSTSQTVAYTEAKNQGLTQNELYAARREIGAQVKGKDLRSSWISKHDHANYSYEQEGQYFFFEENLKGETHEKLTQYAGTYAFNGTVVDNGDDDYEVKATDVTIDQFMTIFEGHINDTVGKDVASGAVLTTYSEVVNFKNAEDEIDYSNFIYYTGKVDFTETQTAAGFFDETTEQYKALSAVNELMFAYSTDSGCLNTYMGYSVSPYGTNFVKEFEKAAQDVVAAGVGNYAVCLTDYGWHIIYCSFSYKAGYIDENMVYGAYNHSEKDTEGTFSNLFYEYIKGKAYSNYSTESQNKILKKYENCAERFESRYKDLYEFDKR